MVSFVWPLLFIFIPAMFIIAHVLRRHPDSSPNQQPTRRISIINLVDLPEKVSRASLSILQENIIPEIIEFGYKLSSKNIFAGVYLCESDEPKQVLPYGPIMTNNSIEDVKMAIRDKLLKSDMDISNIIGGLNKTYETMKKLGLKTDDHNLIVLLVYMFSPVTKFDEIIAFDSISNMFKRENVSLSFIYIGNKADANFSLLESLFKEIQLSIVDIYSIESIKVNIKFDYILKSIITNH